MKKNYHISKTISIKHFISEFGENFSEHMKKELLKLEVRCVLVRNKDISRLDLRHVEHLMYTTDSDPDTVQKEYSYGQFSVVEGILYFSENCTKSPKAIQSPIVNTIYNSLATESVILEDDCNAKKVDDSNIDYIIDSILTVCPQVSEAYMNIVKEMLSYVNV